MATLRRYKCDKCGYTVMKDIKGHYSLMSGEYYNFSCQKCKQIVSISARELNDMGYFPRCPRCESKETLYTWNPRDGRCPKCKGEMKPMPGEIEAD